MEESEKRRERLKAIRMEAAQVGVRNDVETSAMPGWLSNPLIETPATQPGQDISCATPRFDFYTDPMSAFSGNKRRSQISNQSPQDHFTSPGPGNFPTTPSHQLQTNFSPDHRMGYAQSPLNSYGAHRSPMRMVSPFPMQQGTSPGVWSGSVGTVSYCYPPNSSRSGNISSPGFGRGGSPGFSSGRGRGQWLCSGSSSGSGFGGSPSPNSGRGRGHWSGNSPSPNSGRGRGHWSGNNPSPNFGRGGRRAMGSHAHASAEDRPDLFYSKSMIEDPWKFLAPVIWRGDFLVKSSSTPDSLKSWLPKSISMKKARVSQTRNESSSQPSLAEYLAASFNEAVNDA
ncbi:protein SICKLE isoform X2 [Malania oleifera]|uniref:protein SICKLE isoform X2 n=1 Tax=Malania oleifera TaxID=397392 RepID=UPI0025AE6178|nr:protein SICKLE isoform X2 [Malania oleifera]XP_057974131.1 protein SICKLE isoform X2 [Malania oleifera]